MAQNKNYYNLNKQIDRRSGWVWSLSLVACKQKAELKL
jgi:hypothetical protein